MQSTNKSNKHLVIEQLDPKVTLILGNKDHINSNAQYSPGKQDPLLQITWLNLRSTNIRTFALIRKWVDTTT